MSAEHPPIRIARSGPERQSLYRMRYEVYVEEMHRAQFYANHTNKTIIEPLDETAVLLGCFLQNKAIGTCRLNFSSDTQFEHEELYSFGIFESVFPGKVMFVSKLMVLKPWRHTSLFLEFSNFIYETGLKRKTEIIILDCNHHLIKTFTHLGFVAYKGEVNHPEYGAVTPMVLRILNGDHLQTVKSPLFKIYSKYQSTQRQVLLNSSTQPTALTENL